jgi:hypothetical protein
VKEPRLPIPEAQQQLVRAMQAGDSEAVQRLEARMQAVPGWAPACEQSIDIWRALAQWQHQRLQAQAGRPAVDETPAFQAGYTLQSPS